MANFAKIGLNNKVIEVVSLHDNETKDSNGVYSENLGIKFLTDMTGWAVWKQTFEDGTRTTCQWQPPVAEPIDENKYIWNEETTSWDLVDNS